MSKNPIKLNTIFMGTSSFAATILESLIESNYNIVSVFTQPDKKSGRKQKETLSSVKLVAEKKKLVIFELEKFDKETLKKIGDLKPDLIVVAAYGKIIPETVLKMPGFGVINIHPSLLPELRGPSPIQNAILEGKTETGTTIMLMNKEMDAGDILAQEKVSINSQETYPELLHRLANISSKLLLKTLPHWVEREITPQKQNSAKATYCQLIERSDGKIIWLWSAQEIFNRFRAFYPWPGIFTYWERNSFNQRIKIHSLKILEESPEQTDFREGEVFKFNNKAAVKTSDGIILLEEIQLEGKDKVAIGNFLNGYPDFIGSILK